MQAFWAPHLPSYGSVDATTSLHPLQRQQQQPLVRERDESLRVASFQAQQNKKDPAQEPAESFPSLQDLGEAPALFQDAVSSSSLGLGRAPALEENSDKSSASISASSLEEHMNSRHSFSKQLTPAITQLNIVVASLQECIKTLVELQSDSFNQQDAPARLRESSLGSLNSSRANNNNNSRTQEGRSSLGVLTPRTCKSKSEETGSHPELEPEELEQIEAEQEEEQGEEAAQHAAQQKGPTEQQQQQQQQQPLAYKSTWEHYSQKQLPKHKRWCLICWKRGHTTEACWYNNQGQNQQHQTAWATPSTMQQQPARASEKELEHRPYNYSLILGDQPMGSLQQPAQASTQQLAYKSQLRTTISAQLRNNIQQQLRRAT